MNDRRHELQQNDLAIYLDRLNRTIEPYSRLIAVVVGGLIIAAIALGFYRSQQSGQRSDATLQLIQAAGSQDAEVLLEVGETYPGTVAGAWARLYQANQYLAQGVQALYSNRSNAEELLGDAQTAFANAISSSDDPLLLSRAHFGSARAAESLGQLDEATEHYQAALEIAESDEMVEILQQRIEALNKPSTKDFMAWFGEQDFAPAEPSLPPALPGGDALPDLPDLDLPDLNLPGDQPAAATTDEADSMELQDAAAPDAAASDSSPDAAMPAETSPNEPNQPATEPAEPAQPASEPVQPATEPAPPSEADSDQPSDADSDQPADADSDDASDQP